MTLEINLSEAYTLRHALLLEERYYKRLGLSQPMAAEADDLCGRIEAAIKDDAPKPLDIL